MNVGCPKPGDVIQITGNPKHYFIQGALVEDIDVKLKKVLDKIQEVVYDYASSYGYGTLGIDLNFQNGELQSCDISPKRHIKL